MNMIPWRKPIVSTPLPPILTEHEACQLVGFHDAMEAQTREEAVLLRDRLKLEIEAKQDALVTVEAWIARIDRASEFVASPSLKPGKPKSCRRTSVSETAGRAGEAKAG